MATTDDLELPIGRASSPEKSAVMDANAAMLLLNTFFAGMNVDMLVLGGGGRYPILTFTCLLFNAAAIGVLLPHQLRAHTFVADLLTRVGPADDEQRAEPRTKPKPYSRDCLARGIPGATCLAPECDC